MRKSVVIFLFLAVWIGGAAGCQPQTVVRTVEVAVTPQVSIVEVTATPAPTSTPLGPVTVTVCASGCDFVTIQTAIDDANTVAGSTIDVTDAVHTEAGISVSKDVVIQGQGMDSTIVQAHEAAGEATERVFSIAEGATVVINRSFRS